MNILIDIGHPAHVHLFKHFAWDMQKKGHEIFFTCREKEFEIYLLDNYGFQYKSFGKKYSSKIGKFWGMIEFDLKELLQSKKFKPDVFLSHGSFYAAHASWLLGKPHITLEDTGNWEQVRLYLPFTDIVLTPKSFHKEFGFKQINYDGFHELAYLHPNRYQPDLQTLKSLNIDPYSYVILRFISWNASHDVGIKGLSIDEKKKIINKISKRYKIFISSEGKMPDEFAKYKFKIDPHLMHDMLYYSAFLFGESGTMTSECAILGTPAIQISGLSKGTMGTLKKQEEYGLVNIYEKYTPEVEKRLDELLSLKNSKENMLAKRMKLLKENIDVTDFLVWFVENYPESKNIMIKNQEYQKIFLT